MYDGREVAPLAATEDMFHGNASLAKRGPLSIGVPGELAAYDAAHRAHGRLPWSELFTGAIHKAENGFPINAHMANAIERYELEIQDTQLKVRGEQVLQVVKALSI